MWIRSQLEIFLTQMFPNFPELTRLEIGTCNPKCEMLEQISKRWCENNFVFCWKELILFKTKKQHNIRTRKILKAGSDCNALQLQFPKQRRCGNQLQILYLDTAIISCTKTNLPFFIDVKKHSEGWSKKKKKNPIWRSCGISIGTAAEFHNFF